MVHSVIHLFSCIRLLQYNSNAAFVSSNGGFFYYKKYDEIAQLEIGAVVTAVRRHKVVCRPFSLYNRNQSLNSFPVSCEEIS